MQRSCCLPYQSWGKYGRRRELPGSFPLQLLQELQGMLSLDARLLNLAFVRTLLLPDPYSIYLLFLLTSLLAL